MHANKVFPQPAGPTAITRGIFESCKRDKYECCASDFGEYNLDFVFFLLRPKEESSKEESTKEESTKEESTKEESSEKSQQTKRFLAHNSCMLRE